MRTFLRYTLAILTLLSCALLLGLYPYRAALLPAAGQPEQLKQRLAAHLTLVTPPNATGPFPTVLAFHGCGGQRQSMRENLDSWLLPAGFAVLYVDSFAARGITDWQPVCDGKLFWGNERAQDVYAALDLAAAMPQVDRQRLAVMGFSHGGWAILDALAYGGEAGHGFARPGPQTLQLIKAAVTYYPYCGYPAHLRLDSQAPPEIPLLMLLAGQDSVTSHRQCLDSLDALGLAQIQLVQYQAADHVFDQPSPMHTYQPALAADAHRQTLAFLRKHLQPAQ
ncbi:dienelactone hydrolase family protein [Pseudomonas sp. N040]|uniref:dienelactone hydrolase family protein n=1 Tax=Pseudomonas sp. N040 TaxID=2785325 RepID=UPI0018A280A2|nr:dienelactone hydrolase family protein [Pseudomonas sp. N040]MBF7730126.1 dienelactone hydrolase family protein [Pseudomonas sp. N040]MBW7013768.1 dienelactone hydrolase family protein [Pseudomonas sp. N040]